MQAITDPELARLMAAVYGITIPPPPRNDLVAIFATGIPVNAVTGPNYTTFLSDGTAHEYLRLNVAIPPTPIGDRIVSVCSAATLPDFRTVAEFSTT